MNTTMIPGLSRAFPRPRGIEAPTFVIANHPGDNRWYILNDDSLWVRLPFPEMKRDAAIDAARLFLPGTPPVVVEAWKPGNKTGRPL